MCEHFSCVDVKDRCSYRPGEVVQRQTQPGVLLDAEGVCAENRCGGFPKYTVSRSHIGLEVLQTNPEISSAAGHAAAKSRGQQTFSILKVMEIELEHT